MLRTAIAALCLVCAAVVAGLEPQASDTAAAVRAASDELKLPRDYARQRRAAERLASLGPKAEPALPALIGVLRQPFDRVGGDVMSPVPNYQEAIDAAKAAIRAIGPAATPVLIDALAQSSDAAPHLVELLGETNDPRVVEPLVARLGDFAARQALIRLSVPGTADAVAARLTDPSPSVRHGALLTLVARKDLRALPAVDAILGGADQYARMEAVSHLTTLRPPNLRERLNELMKDADASVRFRAAERMSVIGDGRDVPALVAALRDPASQVRWAAASTLGKLKDPRALAPLRAALKVETEGSSRQAMEEAISLIRGR